jgi:NTE family protein
MINPIALMKYAFLIFLLTLFSSQVWSQQKTGRPKIGVTLSGGGAKGLAHIGILKAIDSAGLKVDYITGTSMGSIIGSLYAIGYSGDSIEKIARKIDWDILLSNQSTLRSMVMEEKDEYGRYAIELPWVNHGFRLPSGVLEGEELWLKFSELFYPVHNIKDFSKFSIPFKCIGADVATGEAVVMEKGEIVTAIRSSMAIPSVFTAVENEGRKLVDGGVVRNFPVRDVREMGADFVIGSNVALGLLPKEKLTNALQILMQIAFFKESEDNKKEIKLCDIYIPHPIENYNAASFNRAEELLELGLKEGRKIYPQLKRLADSLNAIYGPQTIVKNRLPKMDSIHVSDIEIHGLQRTTKDFFTHMMGFYSDRKYTSAVLSKMVRKVFGTRYYSRIVYSLVGMPDGKTKIVFEVVENPTTFAKLGIHYTKFTGIGLLVNLTTRNFFTPHSRSLATINLGPALRTRAEHLQYLGRGKNLALLLGFQYDRLEMPSYIEYRRDGLYRTQFFKAEARTQFSSNRKVTLGIGARYEWIKYTPSVESEFEIDGKNDFLTTFGYFSLNTLDRYTFARRGWKIDAEFGHVSNQRPNVLFYIDGQRIGNLDSFGISYSNFQKASLNVETYLPITSRLTFQTYLQTAVNFNYNQNLMNDYMIGGMTKLFRNQIVFAGLEEATISTPSVAALQFGLRYQMFNSFYVTARSNGLVNNFISSDNFLHEPDFLSGHAISFAYNFALGPLELSAMYSDQSKKVQTFISIGISF